MEHIMSECVCFCPQVKTWRVPFQLGDWSYLFLTNSSECIHPAISSRDRNRFSFQNVVFGSKYQMMDKYSSLMKLIVIYHHQNPLELIISYFMKPKVSSKLRGITDHKLFKNVESLVWKLPFYILILVWFYLTFI
jgi:hypothetical protein